MSKKPELFNEYEGVTRYNGVPTTQKTGRMHYNENLYGPSPKIFDTLKDLKPEDIYLYETVAGDDLTEEISKTYGIPFENIFIGNGSSEIIKSILSIVFAKGGTLLMPDPGWSYYTGLADYKFINRVLYPVRDGEDKCYHDVAALRKLAEEYNPKLILITSPAMPTGNSIDPDELEGIIRDFPESIVLVDEAYFGYTDYKLDPLRLINTYDNVVFSRTFAKFFGLANLRLGYGFCSKKLYDVLWLDMPLHRPPRLTKRMAVAALRDKAYYDEVSAKTIKSREEFIEALNKIEGFRALKSDSNFVYIKLAGYDVEKIKRLCGEAGYLIRIFEGDGEKHLRITVTTDDEMKEFTKFFYSIIGDCKE